MAIQQIRSKLSARATLRGNISVYRNRDIDDVLPSQIVEQQFPEFIRTDYPKMVDFAKAYFTFLEQTENGKIDDLKNLDKTSGEYILRLRNEFAFNATEFNFLEDKEFIRYAKYFYSSKGTEESIKFLFRVMFDEAVEIEYPGERIFKPSTARWFQEQSVKVVIDPILSLPPTDFIGNYLQIRNAKGAEQTIEISDVLDITEKVTDNDPSTKFEVFFTTELLIPVSIGDTVFGTDLTSAIIASLTSLKVISPGSNFRIGQVLKLDSITGSGAVAVITNVRENGEIRNVKFLKFGKDYTTNFYLGISPEGVFTDSGSSFSTTGIASINKAIADVTEGFIETQSILRSDYVLNNSPVTAASPFSNYVYSSYTGAYVSQSSNRQVFFLEQDYSALILSSIGAVCKYPGKYLDQTGMASNASVLQDNNVFQDFSYIIKTTSDIEEYKETITALAHPAGFKMFGELSIENVFDSDTNLPEVTNTSDLYVTDFDFTASDTLDNRITYTRTGPATRVNSAGLVETLAANAPRFDYTPVTAGGNSTVSRTAGSATATVTTTTAHGLTTGNTIYALTGVVVGVYSITYISSTQFSFKTTETTVLTAATITYRVSRGLLIEEARTNLLKYSENFGNVIWTPVTNSVIKTPDQLSPTGNLNAWLLNDQFTTNDSAGMEQVITITASTTTSYCLSIFVKQNTAGAIDLYAFFGGNSVKGSFINYNFSTGVIASGSADGGGVIPTVYGKVSYPNNWVRLYFVVTDANNGLNTSLQFRIYPATRAAGLVGSTYVYGAQLEAGSAPTSYIPSTVTFTGRDSSGTYFDSTGTLQTAAANVARYQYNPSNLSAQPFLLLEPASSNFVRNNFAAFNGGSVSTGTAIAPDGTTARKFIPTAGVVSYPNLGGSANTSTFTAALNATVDIAYTGYFSATGPLNYKPYVVIDVSTGNSTNRIYSLNRLNLATGTIETSSVGSPLSVLTAATLVSNIKGMYKFSIVVRYTQDATTRDTVSSYVQCQDHLNTATGYTADGISGFQAALLQCELSSSPTSYIATTTASAGRAADVSTSAAATRGADTAVVTGSNFNTWFNATEGTLYAEYVKNIITPAVSVASFENSSTNFMRFISGTTAPASQRFDVLTSSSNEASLVMNGSETTGLITKVAGAYKLNDIAAAAYGVVSTDTAAVLPTGLNRLGIGTNYAGTYLNGYVRRLTYYPLRLSNAEIRTMTQPVGSVITTQDYSLNLDFIGNTVSIST